MFISGCKVMWCGRFMMNRHFLLLTLLFASREYSQLCLGWGDQKVCFDLVIFIEYHTVIPISLVHTWDLEITWLSLLNARTYSICVLFVIMNCCSLSGIISDASFRRDGSVTQRLMAKSLHFVYWLWGPGSILIRAILPITPRLCFLDIYRFVIRHGFLLSLLLI